ncbi:MAG: DUF4249 domain-containing protein [Bacteroidota bacterium]
MKIKATSILSLATSSVFWLAALLLAGCVDLIEIETPIETLERKIVVEGLIDDGPGPYYFSFFYTATRGRNVFDAFSPIEAYVRDGDGNEEALIPLQDGEYALIGNTIKGEIGQSYSLHFKSNEGEQYESSVETMQAGPKLDSIYAEVNYEENLDGLDGLNVNLFRYIMRIYIDADLSAMESPPYLRWDYQRWYSFTEPTQPDNPLFTPKTCYVLDTPSENRVTIFDGSQANGEKWQRQEVAAVLADFKFAERSIVALTQYSLTESGYNYWQKVDQVVNQTGTIFDSPPALIRGNISNLDNEFEEVLGFFQASAVDTLFLSQNRQDLLTSLIPFCASANANFYFSGGNPCGNCLSIPNSRLNKPAFWD